MKFNPEESIVIMVDVVGSTKKEPRYQPYDTMDIWQLYNEVCTSQKPETFNTWGDGLVANFPAKAPNEALKFVTTLFSSTKKRSYDFIKFRIAMNMGEITKTINPVTERPDIIGDGVNTAARLEKKIINGSTAITENLFTLISKSSFARTKFTEPFPLKIQKGDKEDEIKVRYFLKCCTNEAKTEINKEVSDRHNITSKKWDDLIEDIRNNNTNISRALNTTKEIKIYFINGGASGRVLAKRIQNRLMDLKGENKFTLKSITLATLKVEGSKQDEMLKNSGLLTMKAGTHGDMVNETRRHFKNLCKKLDVKFKTVDVPWPPLGAVLITDTEAYIRPLVVYSADVDELPVICADKSSGYYQHYSNALDKAIGSKKYQIR